MYKVFVNDTPLIITQSPNAIVKDDKGILIPYQNAGSIDTVMNLLKNKDSKNINWVELVGDEIVIMLALEHKFKLIEAAGGIVVNPNNEILLIFRRGMWDLPKGKIEKGESPETAAIREIAEECGIAGHQIVAELPATFHVYSEKGEDILKKCHWFLLRIANKPDLFPQKEEDIEQVLWVNEAKVRKLLDGAYSSVRETVWFYLEDKGSGY